MVYHKVNFFDTKENIYVKQSLVTNYLTEKCNRYRCTTTGRSEDVWDKFVKEVQSTMNLSYNSAIDLTLLEALMGFKGRSMAKRTISNAIEMGIDVSNLNQLRKEVSKTLALEY
ncbi:hypothetical protein ABEB36_007516 [Hypothenemus hampei]|uniref:Uncharacterized protein n=1 Tax=Hypothenemus hampei TaxID=57062 RepID=A0ABD1EUA1_HYPHA